MTSPPESSASILLGSPRRAAFALALLCALMMIATQSVPAQSFTVLHSFTDGNDGATPNAGLTMDRADNFYGTASAGGISETGCVNGCGVAFKLTHVHSSWVLTPIYTFLSHVSGDGQAPEARVVFGPDGALYGTTPGGGTSNLCVAGCGTVFRLTPQATACKSALCPWTETILHSFLGSPDGAFPLYGEVVFDAAGNLYGTTGAGGGGICEEYGCGTVYEISPSNGGWTENILYQFVNGSSFSPFNGVIFGSSGHLYGTTAEGGGLGYGTVYQLTSQDGSWSQTLLYSFRAQNDGTTPFSGLLADQSGDFYGATLYGGTGGGGTVFELSPTEGGWVYSLLYSFSGQAGPYASVTMDAAGSLYGTTEADGAYQYGNVFKLTPSNGSWTYTSLHDFTGGADGKYPVSNVVLDTAGNLYGTASAGGVAGGCGGNGCGVVWEITP
jgi:uncharacterized repeat protein (TIGR03803 family)